MARADRHPHIAALRKMKPVKFEVTLRDGTQKTVPLSTKQNKWEVLHGLLESMPWSTCEAQDNDGNTLGIVECDEVEVDDIDSDIGRAEAFSRILLSAVTQTMSEVRKMFADTMRANADMSRSMLESQHVVVESYQLALKVQQNVMLQQAPPEGDDKVMEMVKLAMMMNAGGKPTIQVGVSPAAKPATKPVVNGTPK
jgi:hypothetical protein